MTLWRYSVLMRRLGIRLPDTLHAALRAVAFNAQRSQNAVIIEAIADHKEVRAELERQAKTK